MSIGKPGRVFGRIALAALATLSSAAFANFTEMRLDASDGGWTNTIGGDAGNNIYLSNNGGATLINSGDGQATGINLATTSLGTYTYQFYGYNGFSNSLIMHLYLPGGTIAANTARDTSSTSFAALLGGTTTVIDGGYNVTLTGYRFTNGSGPAFDHSSSVGAQNSPNIVGEFSYTVAAAVPEPESYALFMAGLGVMGVVARRRKQK